MNGPKEEPKDAADPNHAEDDAEVESSEEEKRPSESDHEASTTTKYLVDYSQGVTTSVQDTRGGLPKQKRVHKHLAPSIRMHGGPTGVGRMARRIRSDHCTKNLRRDVARYLQRG